MFDINKKIQIGDLKLDFPFFLAPMAGVTDYAYRVIAKRISKSDWKGDIICTGYFFMVAIDNQMRPIPIPQFSPKTEEEEILWNKAKAIREEMIK